MTAEATTRPNVVIMLADDMGYSDIGCYGGEIPTPNLDRLAQNGIRMSQFYNTARCSPSRASLLTGLHPHQTGIGILVEDQRPDGYAGSLNNRCVTMAEALGAAGYSTYMSGKWHLTGEMDSPNDVWPTRRGFQRFFGTLAGAGNYWNPATLTRDEQPIPPDELDDDFYYTDAISDAAADFVSGHDTDDPFFLYVAYTAPHWPLHAPTEDIAAMRGKYAEGWDRLRQRRAERLVELGVLDPAWDRSDRDPEVPPWTETTDKEWEQRRMEVYAAQVHRLDAGVGRIIDTLETSGRLSDTIVIFLADNGGCAEVLPPSWADEVRNPPIHLRSRTRDGRRVFRGNTPEVWPGGEETYASYGVGWANLSNTPFREYKHWVHEGGIATPFVVHWPNGGLEPGAIRHDPHQLPDVMATILEITGTVYPPNVRGREPLPLEGRSMLPAWRSETESGSESDTTGTQSTHTLCWEHEGNAAVRRGRWKLVRKYGQGWELYDMTVDRTELNDLSARHPELVADLAEAYQDWATRCGVIPRERILARYRP